MSLPSFSSSTWQHQVPFGRESFAHLYFSIFCLFLHFVRNVHNLRHSHVSIRYPKAVERVLMSPAQHQLHHSEAERHSDRNFGVALSLWDWIFGSFHHSVSEKLTFGIGHETARFTRSVWSMYWLPVRDCLHRLARQAHVVPGTARRALPFLGQEETR